jgi:hypothetical protein
MNFSRDAAMLHFVLAAIAAAVLLLVALASCGAPLPAPKVPRWLVPGPNLTSFIGVRFGESPTRVHLRYPRGEVETSPNGAQAYRLKGIQVGTINYETVLFEFTSEAGMQLAIARFAPDSTGEVLKHLEAAFGPPDVIRRGQASRASDLDASWELTRGERITFDGPARVVVLLGPGGGPLRRDVQPQLESGRL